MLVDTGREQILNVLTQLDAVEDYEMMLFTNNYTIVQGTVIGDLTEVVGAGYARQLLAGWAAPIGPVAGVWTAVAANVVFGNTSGGDITVYGWAYLGVTTAILYGGGNFGAPLTLLDGGSLTFSPGLNDTTN